MAKQKKLPQSTSAPSTSPVSVKRILGLDLSLTGTGWVLYNIPVPGKAETFLLPEMGLINTDKLEGLDRMDHILKNIMNVIDVVNGWLPSEILVVVEDFSFASKGASLFQIAGLGYIIRHYFWTQEIPYVLVPPTVLKKFVTGAGNSDKNVMLKEIYKRWTADINDDNIGDAYGLMRIGRALLGHDENLVGFQKDALKQLEKKND